MPQSRREKTGGDWCAHFFRASLAPAVQQYAFTAASAAISPASAWVEAQSVAAGVEPDLGATLSMVAEEVLTNILKYGGAPPPTIELQFRREAQTIELVIADNGVAFDPTGVPIPQLTDDIALRDVGGLGLVIVRAMMDDVSYVREAQRNRLVLRKRIAPR